jgi:hypothetical protein
LHPFNLNTDTDNNFHIRDVGSPTALWTIPVGEKVVVDFSCNVAASWHEWPEICLARSEIRSEWEVCGAMRPKLEEDTALG